MNKIYILADEKDLVTHKNFEAAVACVGGEPFLCDVGARPDFLQDAAGVLVPGGCDINPALYGQGLAGSVCINDRLDAFQLKAIDYAVRHCIPILGICRGHQMLNVYFGGTLIQDLPNSSLHAFNQVSFRDEAHETIALRGTFAWGLYHKDRFRVNSAHHQAVDRFGEGLHPAMFSPSGVVEGSFHESLPIFSVQWHPERMMLSHRRPDTEDGTAVFTAFMKLIEEGRPG